MWRSDKETDLLSLGDAMNQSGRRRETDFRPQGESVEARLLLSGAKPKIPLNPQAQLDLPTLRIPPGITAARPNLPVLPYGTAAANATFIDPSVHIFNGNHVIVGQKTLIAPYVTLNATTGFIKIADGIGSEIQDNAQIISNPNHIVKFPPSVFIGDKVVVGYGAKVLGPSTIGTFSSAAVPLGPTGIGPNAVIDGATVQAGSIVQALAYVGPGATIQRGALVGVGAVVGPGVTVPTGFQVRPGMNASTPGAVIPLPAATLTAALADVTSELGNAAALARGYTTLYQGASNGAGVTVGVAVNPPNFGVLSLVEGTSQEPGTTNAGAGPPALTTVPAAPAAAIGPKFPTPRAVNSPVEADIPQFRARVIGQVIFAQRAGLVAHHLGSSNSIRADQGQPFNIGSIAGTGSGVTINSPLGGTLTIGQNFRADNGAVILSGTNRVGTTLTPVNAVIGNNVTVGDHAVVDRSSIGSNSTIGARAYILNSNLPANSNVPAGEIIINGAIVGTVQSP
jgi:carbonic anhydrase/acetyltransferase-like protein (isoleucine patch superfamily)